MTDHTPMIVLCATGGIIAAIASIGIFTPRRRQLRAVRQMPRTPIRDVAEGARVKIVGELVYLDQTVTTPISKRTCAYFRFVLKRETTFGGSTTWTAVRNEHRGVDFLVRDDTGDAVVRVDPNAEDAVENDKAWESSAVLYTDEDLVRYVDEQKIEPASTFIRSHWLAEEGVLEAGERVAIVGVARWETAEGGARRLVITGGATPIFMTDAPRVIGK